MNFIENTPINAPAGWTVHSLEECPSTNDVARDLPSWQAVVARKQSAGRGRLGRTWQSGEGGAWFSAVMPAPLRHPHSKLMPLAAGYAVSTAMREFGVSRVRLRWPNDVMVDSRKCGGILVDRFHPDRCVVGVGINVLNDPSTGDIELKSQATRLKDLVTPCPSVQEVIDKVLAHLHWITDIMGADGAGGLIRRIEPFWAIPGRVTVKFGTRENDFNFLGVDNEGRVLLKSMGGSVQKYAPEEIQMLREI